MKKPTTILKESTKRWGVVATSVRKTAVDIATEPKPVA